MDLTPKKSEPWCSFLNCCRPSDSPSELQKKIDDLTKRNEELEADLASISQEKAVLEAKLNKEKKKKTEARERRKKFKSKLADMSEKLKEDLGDDFDGSFEKESDTSFSSK